MHASRAAALFAAGTTAALLMAATPAAATIVNFGGLSQAGGGFVTIPGASYTQDGLTFEVSGGPFGVVLGFWRNDDGNHPTGGAATTSLTSYYAGSTMTITPVSGLFNLQSIDLAPWGAGQPGPSFAVTFDGTKADNSIVSQTFTVANNGGSPQLNTFGFSGFSGLKQVSVVEGVYSGGTAWQFDNLNTGGGGAPEPAEWTLMLMGFGLAGASIRAAKARVAVSA